MLGYDAYGNIVQHQPPRGARMPAVNPAYTGMPESMVISVADAHIGFVIGRGGAVINDIRSRTRTQITISQKDTDSTTRSVTITGIRQANEMALAMIEAKLAQAQSTLVHALARDTPGHNPHNRFPVT